MRNHSGTTRRTFLCTVGVAGLTAVAGCMGGDDGDTETKTTTTATSTTTTSGMTETKTKITTKTTTQDGEGQSMTVFIMSAGSLNNALLSDFKNAVDVSVKIESHGSAEVARLVAEGLRTPDIVALADTALFHQPLTPPWYSVFTSNAVVIAVNKSTKWGSRVTEAGTDGWYKPMVNGNVKLGRTPPNQDPLGYRALFMLNLASRYYEDAENLREMIPKKGQIYPETGLLSRFETGALDAAIVYKNMAVERGYPYINLPDKIDLSNPKYVEEWYNNVSYTLPNGKKIQGDLIAYGATIRHINDATLKAFDVLTTGNYLTDHGFIPREQFPTYEGDVPKRVKQAVSQSNPEQGRVRAPSLAPEVSDITVLI